MKIFTYLLANDTRSKRYMKCYIFLYKNLILVTVVTFQPNSCDFSIKEN